MEAYTPCGNPRLRARTLDGVRAIQSVMLNVPNSEKFPSSNTRIKWASSGPRHCSACPCPLGKYQTSPGAKSADSAWPLGAITVARTLPAITYAHSAATACQCSSRKPPGFNRMETPAMLSDMGNSSTLASLAEPPGPNQPLELSMSYLKLCRGACLAPLRGAAVAGSDVASVAAAIPAAASETPPNNSRRVQPEALLFSWLIHFLPGRAAHHLGKVAPP